MSDAVELMEFWPVDADENIGFVAADSDFQLWLLDGIGISFDDISYSVIDGPDNSGIYELVLDYEDYTTLNELYASYLGDNEYASEEGQSPIMDPMDFGEPVNWTPLDGTPSLKRRKDAEDEPLFKTQKEMDEHKQWLKESKEKFPKGEVRVVGRDKIDKRSALGKMMSRWDAESGDGDGQVDEDDKLPPGKPGEPSSDDEDAHDEWSDKMMNCLHDWQDDKLEIKGKRYGRSYNITAYCPTCNTTALITYIHYEGGPTETMFLPGKHTGIYDFQDNSPPRAYGQSHYAEGSGEIDISPVYVKKKVPVLFKHDYATKDYHWSTDEPSYLTDDQEEELVEIVEQIVEDSEKAEGDESFDEDDYKGDVTWDTYKDDGRFYDLAAEGANPSGGATGDQIISWEHNGLSSPSGPPSDIMWAEDFDAHSLHRFTQKDSRPMDIGITRQKIKKEMFSEVSSFMTLKNLAVLTAAGMAGYLIAGRK